MNALVFPGQGAQFVGMGKELYETNPQAKEIFDKANNILGFSLTDVMFGGTDEELRHTKVTQPAVFVHSVVSAACLAADRKADMVGGHSLGEYAALVVSGAVGFDDALRLVSTRAQAMQKACDAAPSTMAAVIGLPDAMVEQVCAEVSKAGSVVVPANYNCPGQLVISGNVEAVNEACEKLKQLGAKRALVLKVNGAFHSPLMQPAKEELEEAIGSVAFNAPQCPVYQNFDGAAHTNPEEIKQNLIAQLTGPVRWTQEVNAMVAAGATEFTECGPGKVLQGLIGRICRGNADISVRGVQA